MTGTTALVFLVFSHLRLREKTEDAGPRDRIVLDEAHHVRRNDARTDAWKASLNNLVCLMNE